MKTRILLVDDQLQVRQGLRMTLALEDDFAVVGETSNGHSALALAQVLRPNVIIMDITMPEMDGLSAMVELAQSCPQCAVVILSLRDDAATQAQAYAAGAAAFVSKHESPEALVQAIRGARRQGHRVGE
jgi:DNA-binding NarL/FixJ family response regulator